MQKAHVFTALAVALAAALLIAATALLTVGGRPARASRGAQLRFDAHSSAAMETRFYNGRSAADGCIGLFEFEAGDLSVSGTVRMPCPASLADRVISVVYLRADPRCHQALVQPAGDLLTDLEDTCGTLLPAGDKATKTNRAALICIGVLLLLAGLAVLSAALFKVVRPRSPGVAPAANDAKPEAVQVVVD